MRVDRRSFGYPPVRLVTHEDTFARAGHGPGGVEGHTEMTAHKCPPTERRWGPAPRIGGLTAGREGTPPAAGLRFRMAPLADGLLAVLQGEAGPAAARAIGASPVAAGIDDAAKAEPVLIRLQWEVATHPRGPALVAAVASGYAAALRDLDRTEALRSADSSRFGAIFDHTAAGIMIIAPGGLVLEVNPAFCA